jgi:small subunit ribosomal protein S20
MAITKGAKKAHRASLNKHVFNLRRKKALNEIVKKIRRLVVAGKGNEAEALMPLAYKAIDKAAKRGVIKNNTADRKKARLVASVVRLEK